MPSSEAIVVTDRPARYAAQLAKHLGHKIETAWDEPNGFIALPEGAGRCEMLAESGDLRLSASAPDAEGLDRVEDVVKRHLERFATTDVLTVDFQRS